MTLSAASPSSQWTTYRFYQFAICFAPMVISLYAKVFFKDYLEDALSLAKYPYRLMDDIATISVKLALAKAIEHALLAIGDFIQKRQGNLLAAEYQQRIMKKSLRTNLDFNKKYPPSTISSLITNDTSKLIDYFFELCNICLIPMQLSFSMDLIKAKTGDFWILILLLIVFLSYATFYYSKKQLFESSTMKHITEERYRIIQNVNYSIKYIKGQNQEAFYKAKINEIRSREIACLSRLNEYAQMNAQLKKFAQPIIVATILMYYVIFSEESIDMRGIYQIEQSFWIVRQCLNTFPILLSRFLDSRQNMKRIHDFLRIEEINPRAIHDNTTQTTASATSRILVNSSSNDVLPKKITLNLPDITPGMLIVLKGPTASGKSLFFKALLGEYNGSTIVTEGDLSEIAYVGQDNWLASKSIRDNIILDSEFNQAYFNLVIESLDLHKDIPDFSMVINQRSDNLSGGQKQRINIARALYQTSKKLILLDDSFSSLDKRVMKTCLANIKKHFLPTRTIILAINESHYIESLADQVISVSQQGLVETISFSADHNDKYQKHQHISSKDSHTITHANGTTNGTNGTHAVNIKKRIIEPHEYEHIVQDIVGNKENAPKEASPTLKRQSSYTNKAMQTLDLFIEYSSMNPKGRRYLLLATVSVIGYSILDFLQSQIMKYWDSQLFSQNTYIFILILVMIFNNAGQNLRKTFVDMFCIVSSEKIHSVILDETVESEYQLYINQTITPSRIQDLLSIQVSTLDLKLNNQLPAFYFYFSGILVGVVLSLLGSSDLTMVCALCLYMYIGLSIAQTNIQEQKELQKKLKTFSSPLIGYSTQFLHGLSYIRSYGIGSFMLNEYKHLQEKEQYWKIIIKNKKIIHDIWIIFLGTVFNIFSFIYTLQSTDPLSIGPKMTTATHIDRYLVLLVRSFNEIQDSMTSYSKCAEYLKEIRSFNHLSAKKSQETEAVKRVKGNSDSRLKGAISFIDFTAKYNENVIALNKLNLQISAGEKVCIVGRTGSGKSTLLLSLLDLLYYTSGEIRFDNSSLSGETIRDSISIIMQDSIVFEGTVKQNLDPDNKYATNEQLEAVIRDLGLNEILVQNKLSLDMHLEEAGKNLSQGEKQVVSLVRALIQQRSVILFDEANSSIDSKNEEILSNFLAKTSSTVIFIAHKITNVMSFDRIVYLNQGQILEQGKPANLLADKSSHFYQLYNHH